jgi:hypothetical protein
MARLIFKVVMLLVGYVVSVPCYLVLTRLQYEGVRVYIKGQTIPDQTIGSFYYDSFVFVLFQEQTSIFIDVSPIDVVHTPIVIGFLGAACIPCMPAIHTSPIARMQFYMLITPPGIRIIPHWCRSVIYWCRIASFDIRTIPGGCVCAS